MTKMVLSASVLPNTTGRVLHEFALWVDSIVHLMRQCTSRRSSMELQDSSALSRVSSTGTVRPSILQGRRLFKLDGPAIDDGYVNGHSDTSGEAAQPLLDIVAQPRCWVSSLEIIVAAGPEMAGKASESFWTTPCPLSTLSWDLGAKSSAASEQMASGFSG